MSIDDTTATVARSFLEGNSRYRELALAVEEAVESMRNAAIEQLEKELNVGIAHLCHERKTSDWRVTDAIAGAKVYPDFLRRLYKSETGGGGKWTHGNWGGIWIGRWGSHRISMEVCAEGWPADDSASVAPRIESAFDAFVNSTEDKDLWRPDPRNNKISPRISYWFDGDKPCLTGSPRVKAQEMVKLLGDLLKAVDGEAPTG